MRIYESVIYADPSHPTENRLGIEALTDLFMKYSIRCDDDSYIKCVGKYVFNEKVGRFAKGCELLIVSGNPDDMEEITDLFDIQIEVDDEIYEDDIFVEIDQEEEDFLDSLIIEPVAECTELMAALKGGKVQREYFTLPPFPDEYAAMVGKFLDNVTKALGKYNLYSLDAGEFEKIEEIFETQIIKIKRKFSEGEYVTLSEDDDDKVIISYEFMIDGVSFANGYRIDDVYQIHFMTRDREDLIYEIGRGLAKANLIRDNLIEECTNLQAVAIDLIRDEANIEGFLRVMGHIEALSITLRRTYGVDVNIDLLRALAGYQVDIIRELLVEED